MKTAGLLLSLLFGFEALSCSIFMQPENAMVGKNFDWDMPQGELMIRPVGAKKKALASSKTWVSRYGSVTFNQFGPDLPVGGMNTEGLMMEALILGQTKLRNLSTAELVNSLNESEFIQYNLDQYKNVDEVLENLSKLNVKKVHVPIHYFTCDESSRCAVIEFINGKTIVHSDLNPAVLTNLPYSNVLSSYESNAPFSMAGFASYPRFKLLADFSLTDFTKASIWKKLDAVKVAGLTVWQILYSTSKKTIDVKHSLSKNPVFVNLEKVDFGCKKELQLISFEDGDVAFTHKDLTPKLLKREGALKEVEGQTIMALKQRKLVNTCL